MVTQKAKGTRGAIVVSVVIPRLPDRKYDEITRICHDSYCFRKLDAPKIEKIIVSEKQSFAKNVNQGLKQARGDILVISNNDAIAIHGWLVYIKERHEEGGKQLFSMTPRPDCGWCYGITRQTLETVGYLDEGLENSYDDYDYFIRCALNGIPRRLASRFNALHEGGITLRDVYGAWFLQTPERIALASRNREYMIKKWPDLDIDAVPGKWFAAHGVAIMQDWAKKKGIGSGYGRC